MSVAASSSLQGAYTPIFDGQSFAGWQRWWDGGTPSGGWHIEDGAISLSPQDGSGDIQTTKDYRNFDLCFDWKISPGGNSGVIYRAAHTYDVCWMTGPEYQILDNAGHRDGQNPMTSAASCYAMYAPAGQPKPVGEWNQGRIVADANHIQHYLNGKLVVEYWIGTKDWGNRYHNSKFVAYAGYGRAGSGHIILQDHGDRVWYRNLRIRSW